ncbi:MAG: hypothetical protein J7513_09325 [Solirubrobacteraceae bacterium]|nr:hypothetical protein [Solirubrobacteraceae bacterium]
MTAARRLTAQLLLLLAALVAVPGTAGAAGIGMSDGRPVLFDSQYLRDFNFQYVRLVLPWDAGVRAGEWDTWLARASAQGWPVLIAPTGSGPAPSVAAYEASLNALLSRYPAIDSIEGWNEPNHGGQPTAGSPALAAAYFEAARRACGSRCAAVAGNLLDADSMGDYLSAYRAALTTEPAVWGIHNYYDSTYFRDKGVKQMLAVAKGEVWFTETGGLVSFKPTPTSGLPEDEHRAADGLRWLFSLTKTNPRVTRMYLYGMWQQPWNAFDSALLRVDNSEREGMAVVRAELGARQTSPEGATSGQAKDNGTLVVGKDEVLHGPPAGTPVYPTVALDGRSKSASSAVLRLVGKRVEMRRETRRVTVTVRCALADCSGRLTVRAGTWRYSRSVALKAGATRNVRVRLPRRAASSLAAHKTSRAGVSLCEAAGTACSAVPLIRR